MSIAFAFVATHNHFVLDRGGKVFKQTAPVIKLPAGATEDDHLELLGVLNSSAACFWLKQVSHDKGNRGVNEGHGGEDVGATFYRVHRNHACRSSRCRLGFRSSGRRLDELGAERSLRRSPRPWLVDRDGCLTRRCIDADAERAVGRASARR